MIGIPKEYRRYICINIHVQCTFADASVCVCYACRIPSHHLKESTKGGGRPPFVKAAEGRLLYVVAGEVASIAQNIQTYQQMCSEYVY